MRLIDADAVLRKLRKYKRQSMMWTIDLIDIIESAETVFDKFDEVRNLMRCFPDSYVDCDGFFYADKDGVSPFCLKRCGTKEDIMVMVLDNLSYSACLSRPYIERERNVAVHEKILRGINAYLDSSFSEGDILNVCKFTMHASDIELREFIRNGYDLNAIEIPDVLQRDIELWYGGEEDDDETE